MARYGKGRLSPSIKSFGVDKPKQTLIRASKGYEGGMEGLIERAKEHGVGGWEAAESRRIPTFLKASGEDFYNDLKSDRGIAAYLVSQGRDGNYDPRVWQAERADLRSQLDNAGSKSDIKEEIKKPESALERLQSAEREEALSKVAGFEDDRDADGGVEIFNGEWDPNRKYTTDTGRGKSFLDSYSANLKKGIKDVKRQLA